MDRPTTRTFLRERSGAREFLEISWAGGEVELVTGRVGTRGRAQTRRFPDATTRDEYVAYRVKRALDEGYVEGRPGDVPEPDESDPEIERAKREAAALRKRFARTAYLPRVRAGDDAPHGSKYGGTPWIPRGERWPACGGCTQPLSFVLQLAANEAPEDARWAFRDDLLQLFVCDSRGRPGDGDWICQSEGGWKPYAPSTVVRHVSRASGAEPLRVALPIALLDVRRRSRLESQIQYCRTTGNGETARKFERDLAADGVDPRWYEVPATANDFYLRDAFLYPTGCVSGWEAREDVPAYGEIDLEQVDLLREHSGLECVCEDKLGGHPCWVQDPRVPRCRACGAEMRHVLQLRSNAILPLDVGGGGTSWIFACPSCRDATWLWQR